MSIELTTAVLFGGFILLLAAGLPLLFALGSTAISGTYFLWGPQALAMVPVFAALMLLVRGLPMLLLSRPDLDGPARQALALHAGTQLPLVVAIAAIAVRNGDMPGWQAASLVGAGILTVLVYPTLGLRRLAR